MARGGRIAQMVVAAFVALSAGSATRGGTPPTTIRVTNGLRNPLFVTHAPGDFQRIFIVEQGGKIRILRNGQLLAPDFLDVDALSLSGGERGLLGLAFHPQYAGNRRFFVNYTRRPDGATVIAEYQASASNPNVADTAEKVILMVPQPFANHNGGMIGFGADGFLYIGMGDGGSGNDPGDRAQNIENLLGKFLRIDINTASGGLQYSIPPTNPLVDKPGRDEIYAVGLRNPWRWSFDRETQELYAGDVGQGAVEEIDIVTLGGNYGWRVLEGTRCTNLGPGSCTDPVYLPPVVQYNQGTGRCSITGGYVYRGTRNSVQPGTYIYGDYCTGEIFFWRKGQAVTDVNLALDTNINISSFGEDEAGEIYVVGLGGTVHRIAAPSQATSVSAANYSGQALAPESIAAAFGTGLSTMTASAPGGATLPTTLAGVTVRVRNAAGAETTAHLFFVSPTQINFLLPAGTNAGTATVAMTTALGTTAQGTINVAGVSPGLFSANATGRGLAAAVVLRQRADGSQVFEPVARFDQSQNQFVVVPIDLGPETDQVFLVPFGTGFRNRSGLGAVSATVGGTSAQVTFAGAQGQLAGLDQANIRLARSLIGRGDVDVVMTVDGQTTNAVRVNVK
ncbi:MAG: PQQ-dependent sugar dehydrogenase [Blastocatellia bacterium]